MVKRAAYEIPTWAIAQAIAKRARCVPVGAAAMMRFVRRAFVLARRAIDGVLMWFHGQ